MGILTRVLVSVLAALVAGVIIRSIPDISRYLKIRDM